MAHDTVQVTAEDWVPFPGGELEGKRPKALCPACREALKREAASGRRVASHTASGAPRTAYPASGTEHLGPRAERLAPYAAPRAPRPLCFQCYRAELDRDRALKAAGQVNTASETRFQSQLPFEPVDRPRLEMLKADRASARIAASQGAGRFVDKRRRAQIAARHALQAVAAGLKARQVAGTERERVMAMAIHAAELQLPDSWIPFVVSR